MKDPSVTIMSRPIYEEESSHIYNFKDHKFDVGIAILPAREDKDQEFSIPEGIGRLVTKAVDRKNYYNIDETASSMQSCNMKDFFTSVNIPVT